MKKNDKKELQAKTAAELQKLVEEGNAAFAQLKLDHVQNKLKNTSSMTTTRKTIAIIKTLLQEKRMASPLTEPEVKVSTAKGGVKK